YVTLDEIAKMIKSGEDLRVIDNKTKNDITASTLTQLLYESEKKAKTQPSVELLKEIIRHGDGSFSGYIQAKVSTELARFDQDSGANRAPSLNQEASKKKPTTSVSKSGLLRSGTSLH